MIIDWAAELDLSFKEYQQSNSSTFFAQGFPKRPKTDEDDSGHRSKRVMPSKQLSDQEIKQHYDSEKLNKVSNNILP